MDYYKTNDGSFSLYNREYKDYYHSLRDGAILETLYKYVIPCFNYTLSVSVLNNVIESSKFTLLKYANISHLNNHKIFQNISDFNLMAKSSPTESNIIKNSNDFTNTSQNKKINDALKITRTDGVFKRITKQHLNIQNENNLFLSQSQMLPQSQIKQICNANPIFSILKENIVFLANAGETNPLDSNLISKILDTILNSKDLLDMNKTIKVAKELINLDSKNLSSILNIKINNTKNPQDLDSKDSTLASNNKDFDKLNLNSMDINNLYNANMAPFRILDICFGLGYNSFFTIAYAKRLGLRVEIYAPESDLDLLKKLNSLKYPKILSNYLDLRDILDSISNGVDYQNEDAKLVVFKGNAIDFISNFSDNFFDIIYQDAFSPTKNKELWSVEYFKSLFRILKIKGIISTYSSASQIRQNAAISGFYVKNAKFPTLKNGSFFFKYPYYF
ncbi:MAG: hypothetical protein K2P17_08315 [Helicobacteraceae bacterium]|nr:hypothetical protein [Helicobacteraceae bacterium]